MDVLCLVYRETAPQNLVLVSRLGRGRLASSPHFRDFELVLFKLRRRISVDRLLQRLLWLGMRLLDRSNSFYRKFVVQTVRRRGPAAACDGSQAVRASGSGLEQTKCGELSRVLLHMERFYFKPFLSSSSTD